MKITLLKNLEEAITSITADSENIYLGTLTNTLIKLSKDFKTTTKQITPTIINFEKSEEGKSKRNNNKFIRFSNTCL